MKVFYRQKVSSFRNIVYILPRWGLDEKPKLQSYIMTVNHRNIVIDHTAQEKNLRLPKKDFVGRSDIFWQHICVCFCSCLVNVYKNSQSQSKSYRRLLELCFHPFSHQVRKYVYRIRFLNKKACWYNITKTICKRIKTDRKAHKREIKSYDKSQYYLFYELIHQ